MAQSLSRASVITMAPWALAAASFLSAQEPLPTPKPVPTADAPTNQTEATFIPADLLLQQADARRPVTEQGWIVTGDYVETTPIHAAAAPTIEHYEYFVRLQQIDSQIRIARAVVASYYRRLRMFHYFNKTGALFITTENANLALLNAEETLRNLRYERLLIVQQHRDQMSNANSGVVINDRPVSTN